MTWKRFVWIYDYYFGILNPALQSLGVIGHPVDWLGDDSTVMGAMVTVGIFVSLPFTTYVLLAGLQAIPADVFEAARVDGASAWRTYGLVTFPLLRPALLVAAVLNIIYVFNSFPIVWTLNDRNPGFGHDTMITYMYKIAFKSSLRDVGLAAALGVVNVLLILLAVLVYLLSVALASTALVVLAAVPAAYYTARHRFRGRTAFLFLVLVTQMFSPTALVVGLHREFFELGLINTYAALILTNAAFNLAFAIWILRAFFASIPREIEDAAAVDGCGRLRVLVRIVLPLSLPGVVTAGIFAFIAAWNEYIVALTLMTDPDKRPLTVGITSYVTAYVQHWNSLFAASIIPIVPVVVLFAVIERHLVGGLTAGSVK